MPRKRKKSPIEPPIEIDFHGWSAEEVYAELTNLVDRHAGRKGTQIRVIHGKGAGILEAEVARFARNDPRVSSSEKEFFNPGVTTLILSGRTGSSPDPLSPGSWDRIPTPRVRKRKR